MNATTPLHAAPPSALTNASRPLARTFFLRVYLALLAALLLFMLLSGAWWRYNSQGDAERRREGALVAGDIASRLLPSATSDRQSTQKALDDWHARALVDLALFDSSGTRIAAAGREIGLPSADEHGFSVRGRTGPVFIAPLPDGRRLALALPHGPRTPWLTRRFPGFLGILLLAAVAVAAVAWPIARGLSARLERLERGVTALGRGDLGTRVPIEGRDEVAALAASFNDAAQRIEQLVAGQRSLLANASHELRSPLARIRMAIELLPKQGAPSVHDELQRDIAELDQLVDEILLASRLTAEAGGQVSGVAFARETVDLVALCAEECARVDARLNVVDATASFELAGEPRLLRRLLRNLLENAKRYGADAPIEVTVSSTADANGPLVRLTVADRGPGVPQSERERIFEPFYRSRSASERDGGVGLGLSLAQQIAHRHGTRIVCQERAGGGGEFVVELRP